MRRFYELLLMSIHHLLGDKYLVLDTFTDNNGVTLSDHALDRDEVGNGWIARPTNWTINTNRADPPAI